MSNFWKHRRVWVTGGTGFLGTVVTRKLHERGCQHVFATGRADGDLTDRATTVRLLKQLKPQLVIHLAAVVGGISAERERKLQQAALQRKVRRGEVLSQRG